MAHVNKLRPLADLDLIDDFASHFSLDPDFVFSQKSFDTVINFAYKWKETGEFNERYRKIEKMMNDSAAAMAANNKNQPRR